MNAKSCDRCGKFYFETFESSGFSYNTTQGILLIEATSLLNGPETDKYDLCNSCLEKLKKFLKKEKEK